MSNIRLNWVAILVAAIASFIFEALWFSVFMNEWLAGIGRTREWLTTATGITPARDLAPFAFIGFRRLRLALPSAVPLLHFRK